MLQNRVLNFEEENLNDQPPPAEDDDGAEITEVNIRAMSQAVPENVFEIIANLNH